MKNFRIISIHGSDDSTECAALLSFGLTTDANGYPIVSADSADDAIFKYVGGQFPICYFVNDVAWVRENFRAEEV